MRAPPSDTLLMTTDQGSADVAVGDRGATELRVCHRRSAGDPHRADGDHQGVAALIAVMCARSPSTCAVSLLADLLGGCAAPSTPHKSSAPSRSERCWAGGEACEGCLGNAERVTCI